MTDLPVVMTTQGAIPTPPVTLLAQLLALVATTNPGYTANLPGSLIEDVGSTEVGGLTLMDQARVDTINSLTPYGTNEFLTNQLGQVYGVQEGGPSNTSVYVVFSSTTNNGLTIPIGYTVSDGTYQYTVQDGGVILSGGSSAPLFCLATQQGSWSVGAGTVNAIISTIPSGVNLTCTNPLAGTPGNPDGEDPTDYQTRVLEAGLVSCQGMPNLLRVLLANVSGVQDRLVSIRPSTTSGFWEILCGGNGDPYAIAYAIYQAIFDITHVLGSTANPSYNITVSLLNYPDTYTITFVNPIEQDVTLVLTWSTNSPNAVSPSTIAQLGQAAINSYINSIYVGAPLNLYEVQTAFLAAIAPLIPTTYITEITITVALNGTPVNPDAGTNIISGDPEGYFLTNIQSIVVQQG